MTRRCLVIIALTLLMCSCYRDLLPTGQVISDEEWPSQPSTSGVTYSKGEPRTEFPIMPLKTWALRVVDEVLTEVANHPRWWMLEICQVELEDGSRHWFTIDTELDGTQYVGISDPILRPMADIFPSEKYDNELNVKVREFVDRRVYVVTYKLPDGTAVNLEVQAPLEMEPPSQRNGNAMTHSEQISLVLIDLAGLEHGHAKIKFDDELMETRDILWFYERTWRISQTAGGIAIGEVENSSDYETGNLIVTMGGVKSVFKLFDNPNYLRARAENLASSAELTYLKNGRALELARVMLRQGEVATFDLQFNPALPDFRYNFEGEYTTKVMAGMNGRSGYMHGRAVVTPVVGGYKLLIQPYEPRWARVRPIEVDIKFKPDSTVEIFNRLAPEKAYDD